MYRGIGAIVLIFSAIFLFAPILPAAEEAAAPAVPADASVPANAAEQTGEAAPAAGDSVKGTKKHLPEFVDGSGNIQWKRASDISKPEPPKEERSLTSVIFSIVIWSAVVVLLIIGGFFLFKKFVPGSKHLFGSKLMRILGRTNLSPKHSVYLLKVGERVIVLGVTGDEIRPLSEITDAREVAFLSAEGAQAPASDKPFGGLFSKKRNSYSPKPAEKETLGEAKEEIERIRTMVGSWKERYQDGRDSGKESVS